MVTYNPTTKPKSHFVLAAFVLFCFLLTACSAGFPANLLPQPSSNSDVSAVAATEVDFVVQPPISHQGEEILLEILDEVTGLALNPARYIMTRGEDGAYSARIPLMVGSLVKYRYMRGGDHRAAELNGSGEPVRYRMFYVPGTSLVARDQIAGWSDSPYGGPTGRLTGQVVDSATGSPIPNLMIAAGGEQTFTSSDGAFFIDSVPVGEIKLIAYSLDGAFVPFQQGAVIQKDATTPAQISIARSPLVNVTFDVTPPAGSQAGLPIRLIGNTLGLGNTFADLGGGVSTIAARAPQLAVQPDGHYSITLQLPVGLDLRYKYSLGDGFWNAEQTLQGNFAVRQLIVPSQDIILHEEIAAWTVNGTSPVTFIVKTPADTPAGDVVSIQFNPFAWTPAIPMWPLGDGEWAYILSSPLHMLGEVQYRYCRNDQCGSADAGQVISSNPNGFKFVATNSAQTMEDQIQNWANWQSSQLTEPVVVPSITARGEGFIAGIELQRSGNPTWQPYETQTVTAIQELGANWAIFSPGWTVSRFNPPMIEQLPERNALWPDTTRSLALLEQANLKAGVYPRIEIAGDQAQFWSQLNESGWQALWFERYTRFILHHADLAQVSGAEALVLGDPIPGDFTRAEDPGMIRWAELLQQAHARFSGEIWWAVPFTGETPVLPPGFEINQIDGIYLLWQAPISNEDLLDQEALNNEFNRLLTEQLKPLSDESGLPIILALNVPSAVGAESLCIDTDGHCASAEMLEAPATNLAGSSIDLPAQAAFYSAALFALQENDWVVGLVSQGFYPPAAVQDRSTSVRGKPAGDLLWYWFPRLTGKTP